MFLGRIDRFGGLPGHHARDGAAAPDGGSIGVEFVNFGQQHFGIGAGVGIEGGIGTLIEDEGAQLAVRAALAEIKEEEEDDAGERGSGEDDRKTVHNWRVEMKTE